MNATFNLKRFFLLEQYKKLETGKHLLWSAGIVLGICLLCMMYDITQGLKLLHRTYTGFLPQPLRAVVSLYRPLPVGDKYHQTDLHSIPVDARFRF